MKKFLSLITVFALFTPCASFVSGCEQNHQKQHPTIKPKPRPKPKPKPKPIPFVKINSPLYSDEKKALVNFEALIKLYPLCVETPNSGEIAPKLWDRWMVVDALNDDWNTIGGLCLGLYNYVYYQKVKIIRGKFKKCEMYFNNNPVLEKFFGYTKENPYLFYIKGV